MVQDDTMILKRTARKNPPVPPEASVLATEEHARTGLGLISEPSATTRTGRRRGNVREARFRTTRPRGLSIITISLEHPFAKF